MLSRALELIPFGPVGAVALIAAAAIGTGLYAAMHQAASASQELAAQMQKLISASNITDVQSSIAKATEATTAQINSQEKALGGLYASTQKAGTAQVNLHTGDYTQLGQAVSDATDNINADRTALQGYANENATAAVRITALGKTYGDTAAQAQLLTLAGVKQSDAATANASAWAADLIKIQATAEAYGIMGQQAGAAGDQLDTLAISTGTVTKATQTLVQAEQAWLSLITGGDSGFTSFEEGFTELSGAMSKTSATGATLYAKAGDLKDKFTEFGATLNGTTQADIAARQAFDSQIQAAGTLFGNLQSLAAASGNTASAQKELTAAGKDTVAQLLPMAQGSKEATAEVSALAQLVGGPATDNFQVLSKWVGNTKGAETDLNKEQAALTESSDNLSTAAKNLAGALQSDVTASQAQALLSTTNFANAQKNLVTDLQKSKGALTSTASEAAGQYFTALTQAGLSTSQATTYVDALLTKLGVAPDKIAAVNKQLGQLASAQDAASKQTSALTGLQQKLAQAFEENTSKATTATTTLAGQYYKALLQAGDGATEAKNDVDAFLTRLGATQGVVNQVNAALASLPKQVNIAVVETVSAIATKGTTTNILGEVTPKSARGGIPVPAMARGGFTVPSLAGGGASGQDNKLVMMAPGELVIPSTHAPLFRDQARKAGIPGFSSGGSLDAYPSTGDYGFQAPLNVDVSPPTSYASAAAAEGNTGLPPATTYQMAQLIALVQTMVKQNAQQPYTMAQALTQANGQGVRRGYYATSG